jgi:DNA-binding NarL/FixJ family response regulator
VERRPELGLRGEGCRRKEAVRKVNHHGRETMKTVKEKRPTAKVFIVSDDTHRKLKAYAMKMGYKLQYVADEAVAEYLKRKEQQ